MSDDLAGLMQEPPGGQNHGRKATADGYADFDGEAHDFLIDEGWSVVDIHERKERAGGLTGHRGVLAPDDEVDRDVLQALVERELGFTYEEIASVYREGRPSTTTLQLRDEIDARLLELSRSGGNMIELAKALGWSIENGHRGERSKQMERALARARGEES